MPIPLSAALTGLAQQAANHLAIQQIEPGRPDTGAVIRADWGLAEPGSTAGLVALCLWTHLVRAEFPDLVRPIPDDAALARRALLAVSYLERAQRPSGLTDLRDCNYDSSPDGGFILQAILPPLLRAQQTVAPLTGDWQELVTRLTAFARRMTIGVRDGGFHTPNHRWVMAGALHLAQKCFPDLPGLDETIAAYLAEGVDLDEEGFYIEHSAGVYDAICARSLFLLADRPGAQGLPLLVARNLDADFCLLNADATIETGLSRRQDAGMVPSLAANLAVPYAIGAFFADSNAQKQRFEETARFLWETTPPAGRDYFALSQTLLTYGEPSAIGEKAVRFAPPVSLPPCRRTFSQNGLWRFRDRKASVSVFRDQTRLLNFRYGSAFLASVSIHQSYFGVGQFVAETLETEGDSRVRLATNGQAHPTRPGYDYPLGRPVAPDAWKATRAERTTRRLPPNASELIVETVENGLRVRYRTLDGLDNVTAQIALDFAAGGVWETSDTRFEPQAGQTIFLKSGAAMMRYASGDALSIGPGASAHFMARMRDAAPPAAPGLVRVLLTFVTPIDHVFTITGTSGV